MSIPAEKALSGAGVSRETIASLQTYVDLLLKWTKAINLISKGSVPVVWDRHILDSVQVFRAVQNPEGLWADLGSGGGLPGAVVAILAKEFAPGLRVLCVESDQRKSAFLRNVSRETGAGFDVISERIEALKPLGADIISARALARLPILLEFTERHLKPSGTAVFLKGASAEQEITEARSKWRFGLERQPSATDSSAAILKIQEAHRV